MACSRAFWGNSDFSPAVWQTNSTETPCTFRKIDTVTVDLKYILSYLCFRNVSPVTLPLCSFMDRHQVAGDSNAQNCENVWAQPQNLSMKMLRCYAVTLLDLSMESIVNQPAQHFVVTILKFHCPVKPAVINVVILCKRHGVRRA